jgi:hypothetical protein
MRCLSEQVVWGLVYLVLESEHTVVPQTNLANLELGDDLVAIVAAGLQMVPV